MEGMSQMPRELVIPLQTHDPRAGILSLHIDGGLRACTGI